MSVEQNGRTLAVFVDFENIALGLKGKRKFNIQIVMERLVEKGKIVVKKAYADWVRYAEYKHELHEAGLELIEIPKRQMAGKNSADIRLVVDALDLSWAKEHIDTFVIVSGDSDFSPLVSKLKENGKSVIGLSLQEAASTMLKENCDENWLAVPSRYALNAQKWMDSDPRPFKYGPIEYLYLTYPFHLDNQFGFGFHGKKWCGAYGQGDGYYWKEKNMKGVMLDNIISFQGSCWFMGRENFYRVGGMQYEGYYEHQEAQEIGFKVWTSGGRCIVNKKTWYAHLHKGPEFGRGYHMLKHHQMESNIYATKVWMNHPGMRAVVDRFWPLDYWPEDWDDHRRWENYDFGWWHKSHEIREKVKEVTGIDGKIHPIPYEVIKGVYDTVMEGILE